MPSGLSFPSIANGKVQVMTRSAGNPAWVSFRIVVRVRSVLWCHRGTLLRRTAKDMFFLSLVFLLCFLVRQAKENAGLACLGSIRQRLFWRLLVVGRRNSPIVLGVMSHLRIGTVVQDDSQQL